MSQNKLSSHIIVCRNCDTRVAKTPNKKCVSCSIPNWGYTNEELLKINNPTKQIVQKLVCKNCDNTVVRTPLNKCHLCEMPYWGYTEFELDNGLVNLIEIAKDKPKKGTVPKKHSSNLLVGGISLIIIFLVAVFLFVPNENSNDEENLISDEIENNNIEYASNMEEVQKAVVFIKVSGKTGTGFLISNKYILTAGHVACGGNDFEITFTKFQNKKYRAKLVHCALISSRRNFEYFERDFALLEISPINNIKPLKLGNSDNIAELDDVYTAGHSLGDANLSLTEGDINSLKFGRESFDLFKHTIASNPGNSGGPIINKSTNEVVAILVGGRSPFLAENNLIIPQGENIGVKINNVKYALNEYIN
ncbi:serine protease [Polaribacter vadi]|uniref:S1 family peptidase n=1 Tax=Polaribacter TaxID=52959 RepID=UPI001C08B789|nr:MULTISPECIES: serine protease [Polaribacter]MBU3012681.1 serine protease [Polaribacter vadi]MDO6742498.1 serine protease [Polaribacter sp. 1_MG-2023]